MQNTSPATKFEETMFLRALKLRNSTFTSAILDVYEKVEKQLANRIPAIFPEYTQHDVQHSIRVMEYMYQLIEDVDRLNDFEITLLVHAALFHDIGMATSSDIIDDIKKDQCSLTDIRYSAMVEKFHGDESLAIQEIIRLVHGDLSEQVIRRFYSQRLGFSELDGISFSEDVGLLAKSHTKDFSWITNHLKEHCEKSRYSYNLRFSSVLLRLGDILDFDSSRTPLILYKIIEPKGVSDDEWRKHSIITNLHKIKPDRGTNQKKIDLHGECHDASIHRKVLKYIELINKEIENAVELTAKMEIQYRIFLKNRAEVNIEPKGYTISDFRLSIDFRSITSLLMGERIYGDKSLGIRELIQNSIDACKVRRELDQKKAVFGSDPYLPTIKIILEEKNDEVIIKDNGCGMNEEIIKNYFLNIGKSYYTSDDYLLKKFDYNPIGNYGIGFLACFMLSDKVKVKTSQPTDSFRYDLELERGSEYISFTRTEDPGFIGTEVILNFTQLMEAFRKDKSVLKLFISSHFISDNISIQLFDRSNQEETDVRTSLSITDQIGKNEFLIDLSQLMSETSGHAIIKQKHEFIRNIQDIETASDSLLYFDGSTLEEIGNHPVSLVFSNNIIKYLRIPLYEYSDKGDFDRALQLLEDMDEVIEKVDPHLTIAVFVNAENQSSLYNDKDPDGLNDLGCGLTVDEVIRFLDISGVFCPKVYVEERTLLTNESGSVYLPYKTENIRYFIGRDDICKLFIRDIFLRNFPFKAPVLPWIIEIKKIRINIESKQIVPDISRNSLNDKTAFALCNSLTKAMCIGGLRNFELANDEKEVLAKFLDTFYGESTLLAG
jgi:hypothetical protein